MTLQDFRADMVHLTCCECASSFYGPLLVVDDEWDLCSDACLREWRSHGSVPRLAPEPPREYRSTGVIVRAELRPELVME